MSRIILILGLCFIIREGYAIPVFVPNDGDKSKVGLVDIPESSYLRLIHRAIDRGHKRLTKNTKDSRAQASYQLNYRVIGLSFDSRVGGGFGNFSSSAACEMHFKVMP